MGTSIGLAPTLSGMRASFTLMATRSSERAGRPPAWPVQITSRGRCCSISASSLCREAPNTVGISPPTIRWPATVRPSSAWMASQLGLTALPPKGSKPVTNTDNGLLTAGLAGASIGSLYSTETLMRWEGNRESSNVEDMRSGGGGGGFGLGGGAVSIGAIVIALIGGAVLGVNPLTLLS